jgi:hypothetical protein
MVSHLRWWSFLPRRSLKSRYLDNATSACLHPGGVVCTIIWSRKALARDTGHHGRHLAVRYIVAFGGRSFAEHL